MSIVQNQSILLGEFSSLNEQNRRLRGEMIEITLGQEKLIEENHRLEVELERKEMEMVECRLREKNLQHSLQQVNKLYTSLQHQHNTTLTLATCHNPLQLRTLYKKQTQLAMDLAFIQRQSYRQAKKSKTHQLQLYQQRIVSLLSQNDKLNKSILQLTSEYNERIYELKGKLYESEGRLRRMGEGWVKRISDNGDNIAINSSNNRDSRGTKLSSTLSDIAVMQLQLKLQNTRQKLQLYIEENTELRRRNLSLVQQNDSLLQQIAHTKRREKHNRHEQHQYGQQKMNGNNNKNSNNNNNNEHHYCQVVGKKEHCEQIEYIQTMMQENYKLKKEIEQVTRKYTLLTETYPKLVQDFDAINQLQTNMHKLSTVNQLQHQLTQSHTLQSTLTQSLSKLQSKYLQELKSRESAQYKCSILTKRFNQIFIKMNPYFNIYQYQSLELNQEEFIFFNANKDYRQLKEYEREVGQVRRELKEEGYLREKEGREYSERLAKKQQQLVKLKQQLTSLQSQFTTLNTTNKQLTQQLHNYQLLNIDTHIVSQRVNQHKLNNEITLPLLQRMVDKLQLQRQHLLKSIYEKDVKIVQLARELREAMMVQRVVCVEDENKHEERQNNMAREHNSGYQQLAMLIRKNEELQQKYDNTMQQLTTIVHKMQSQLSSQHDIYQAQTKQYQEEYSRQFMQMNVMIEKWKENCGRFKALFMERKGEEIQSEREKIVQEEQMDNNREDIDGQQINKNDIQIMHAQQQQLQHHQLINNNAEHNQLLLLQNQASLNNLDVNVHVMGLGEQGNNSKLIGESTVQNLTVMLKKYEQEMSEVLTMCAKLTEQYNELKQQLKSQQQLQQTNTSLTLECNNLTEQLTELKHTLQQKNISLQTTQTLYKQKQAQYQHLQTRITTQAQQAQAILEQERNKNHLLSKQLGEIKEKLYSQLSSSPESINNELMSKGEFETIVVMHANKNKEISHLVQTNKVLEMKVDTLMKQLNHIQQQSASKKAEEISPLEKSEIKQLNLLLKSTNLLDLVKKANQIIQKQQKIQHEQKEIQQQRNQQGENEMVEQGELRQQNEAVQDKDKSLEY